MKTSFPPPYNPQNLPPPDEGYRYIGADEKPLPTDDTYTFSSEGWIPVENDLKINRASDVRWTFRRRIDSEGMNMPSPSAKPILKPGQTIVVRVHDSQALSHAVQQIAFDYGWKWPKGQKIQNEAIDEYGRIDEGTVIFICLNGTSVLGYNSFQYIKRPINEYPDKYLLLDARTDLGTLIDLLNERDKTPTPPKVNGYEAQFKAGDTEVTFGCAKINLVLLEKAASLMGYVVDKDYRVMKNAGLLIGGNRSVISVKLDSDVELKSADIIATLDYVHNVIVKNKA